MRELGIHIVCPPKAAMRILKFSRFMLLKVKLVPKKGLFLSEHLKNEALSYDTTLLAPCQKFSWCKDIFFSLPANQLALAHPVSYSNTTTVHDCTVPQRFSWEIYTSSKFNFLLPLSLTGKENKF